MIEAAMQLPGFSHKLLQSRRCSAPLEERIAIAKFSRTIIVLIMVKKVIELKSKNMYRNSVILTVAT